MKKILVATDGSEDAERAIDFAAQLAKTSSARLLIVNVTGAHSIPEAVLVKFSQAEHVWVRELLASLSSEILQKARDRARALGLTDIALESRSGDVAQTILEVAEQFDADAIVVGKRGSGRVAGLLLGSVSQKLVSLASQVVIVVP
jgi:nucleotide-binding universal stress UspA family protein